MKVRVTEDGIEFRGDTFDGDSILELCLAGNVTIDDQYKQHCVGVIQDMIAHHVPEMST